MPSYIIIFLHFIKKKKPTWVLAHPAILCHGVHLYLPGTTDELGDDHWVLLKDKQ